MPEPLNWLPDGTPYSARFEDRYHSSAEQGLAQARQTFVAGCGLPAAWAGQAQWRVLETGFGLGLNFLVTWAAWRADPKRCARLHYSACEAWPVSAQDLLRAAPDDPEIAPLAQALAAQWWGLLPGVHRLVFDEGRVQLTLLIGDAQALLRQQQPPADSVYLDGFAPDKNPDLWSGHTLKALARCCRRGTRAATWCVARSVRDALAQCGFDVQRVAGTPPKRDNLQCVYAPRWEPRAGHPPLAPAQRSPASALVIGAGISGANVAAQLAERGWRVTVLEAHQAAARGASGIPSGVFASHVSPDDSLLSRLTRAGVRATLTVLHQWAADLHGRAWDDGGVLEHGVDAAPRLAWSEGEGLDWSRPSTPEQLGACGLAADAASCWHARGGWMAPRPIIERLLAQPGITLRTGAAVQSLARASDGQWQALDGAGQLLAQADTAIVCAGFGTNALLGWQLQPLRGVMSFGSWPAQITAAQRAPFALNGHGNFMPAITLADASAGWAVGSTFERDQSQLPLTPLQLAQAHADNLARLTALAPAQAQVLAPQFSQAQAFAGVRCAAPNHLPVVTPLLNDASLWACTAMSARGLTLAPLCAQLLAARLHGEPLPLDSRLARAMDKIPA